MPTLQNTCREATYDFGPLRNVQPPIIACGALPEFIVHIMALPPQMTPLGRAQVEKPTRREASSIGSLSDKVPRVEPNSGKTGTKTGTQENCPWDGIWCRQSALQPLHRHRHIRSAIHQKSKAKHPDVNMFSLTNGAIVCPTVTDMAHFVLPRSIAVGVNYRNYLIFKELRRPGVFIWKFPWMA